MDRRGFLRGLFAAPAIVAASSLMPVSAKLLLDLPPKLWGDGIHDDTAALQALLDGVRPGGSVNLNGIYRVTRTLKMKPGTSLVGGNSTILANHGDYALHVPEGKPDETTRIHSVHFRAVGSAVLVDAPVIVTACST